LNSRIDSTTEFVRYRQNRDDWRNRKQTCVAGLSGERQIPRESEQHGESAESERVASVARKLGAELERGPGGLLLLRKVRPTPKGFPRRIGVARKRPLA